MTFRGRTLSSGAYPRSRENRNTLNNKTGKVKSKLHNLSTTNEKLNFYMKYIYHLVDCILTPLHYDNKNFSITFFNNRSISFEWTQQNKKTINLSDSDIH